MNKEEKKLHVKVLENIAEQHFYANNLNATAKAAAKKAAKNKTEKLTKELKYYLNKNEDLKLLALNAETFDIHTSFDWDDYFRTDLGLLVDDILLKLAKD